MTPALDQLTGPVTDVNPRGEGVLCRLSPISGIFARGADLEAAECSKGGTTTDGKRTLVGWARVRRKPPRRTSVKPATAPCSTRF